MKGTTACVDPRKGHLSMDDLIIIMVVIKRGPRTDS